MISAAAVTRRTSRRKTGTRKDLLGDRRAAEHMATLETSTFRRRARDKRRGEAVVSAADDDCVVTHAGHCILHALEALTVDIHMLLYLAGRVLLGGFFIISGIRHFSICR
jgi:hypothetical protein